jgi:hypothetical protein
LITSASRSRTFQMIEKPGFLRLRKDILAFAALRLAAIYQGARSAASSYLSVVYG